MCRILKLYSVRSGRMYYQRLNTKYFTDEVLEKLNISREVYSRIKVFDIVQTQTIMKIFKIGEVHVH